MPNLLVAGNSTNGGTAITTDTSGTLNIVTGSGSGSNAITIDTSQNVVFSGNVSGVIKSGTAVASTSGTSIEFTGIPSTAKRVTVMFSGVSTNSTATVQIQIGSSSFSTSGYSSSTSYGGSASQFISSTSGFYLDVANTASASNIRSGLLTLVLINSNTWVATGTSGGTWSQVVSAISGNSPALSGALDRVRITTTNGTDTFDAGTVNILWE